MTPGAIIAAAWAQERERYRIIVVNRHINSAARVHRKEPPFGHVYEGSYPACQAHLDQLCATAVLTAIREAEAPFRDQVRAEVQAFVNAYAGPKTVAFFARRMEAMLAAAPPLGER